MSPTNPDVENALLTAAAALPGHFSDADELTIQALTALQATTLSLPGGAYAVETVTKGDTGVGAVVLVITGLVDHKNGEVFSRDEARTLWTAALSETVTSLGEAIEGLSAGQLHMTDAFDALDNADEATVVGIFRGQTLACLLLAMPAQATGQGAAAQLAAAVAEASAEAEAEEGDQNDDGAIGEDGQEGGADGADSDLSAATDTGSGAGSDTATGQPVGTAAGVGDGTGALAPPAAGGDAGLGSGLAAAQAPITGPQPVPATLQPLTGALAYTVDPRRIELLRDVMMGVSVELGRARMSVQEILGLTPGAIIELDRAAGAPVDVLVNGKLIAHGEVVVVDEEFAVRISEVIGPDREGRVSA